MMSIKNSSLRLRANLICQLGIVLALAFHSAASAEVVFSESFESPVVSGFNANTVPDNGNWIGSRGPYNATVRGHYNDLVEWPDTPKFTTPYGDQGYMLAYSTTMLTTAQGATGQTITAGVTYTLTFNAAREAGTTANYKAELVAFEAADDNASREDPNSPAGTFVASASGAITSTDMSDSFSVVFTPDATNAHLGKELAIRFDDAEGNAIYDNVRLIAGHDYAPNPASGEDLSAGGNITLSWTNKPPVAPASATPVDILFGTDPGALSAVQDGQLINSTVVSAPTAGTYYWQIVSYPDGDPDGTPDPSTIYNFTIADTDADGLPDEYELANATDPDSPTANTDLDPASDLDSDDLTAAEEYIYGTDPNIDDTDEDNLLDGHEINGTAGNRPATNPLLADTDNDGLNDDVETNTGLWVSPTDTGTNPIDPDWDDDGLVDGVETNDNNYLGKSATGSDPYDADSDDDNVLDWYEVTASFTNPNDANSKPPLPYPLPDPDGSTGATDKPVKVYIMSGQSNMVGFGTVSGTGDGTLETMIKRQNKFPNLVDASNQWTTRQDVRYRGVVSDVADTPLSPGNLGSTFGPELGFGYVMGWYHDEPVLLIKSSIGNRSLAWDILPAGSPSYEYDGKIYAGYGEAPATRNPGDPVATDPGWWAGYEWDRYFMHESEFVRPQGDIENVVDVLDNFATDYPDWADQGFEIAGFVWWQGDKDRYDMGYASRYEHNLVNLIDSLRSYYSNRYPGKVATNAPFVLATLGQTAQEDTSPEPDVAVFDAQMAVDGEAGNYPQYAGNVKTVYSYPLSAGGASNGHYNKNAVTYMMVGDALGTAMLNLLEDNTPPSPDPMTFEIAPSPVDSSTIGMVATTATDASGPVEYYFENIDTAQNSGWTTSTSWNNTGLAEGSYDYHVKARDTHGTETAYSVTVTGSTGTDSSAPTPDPMSFETAPTAQGQDTITMTATTALDVSGVEYFFDCTTPGGTDSGWQDSPVYTDTGLNPGTEYTYLVQARDKSAGQNTTVFSSPASATTDPPDLIKPSPNPMTFATPPTALGETSITMTATSATDDSAVEYYFECTAGLGNDSGWQDSTEYTDIDLAHSTEFTYVVRARDKSPAQNTTANSSPASATTDAPDLTPPGISTLLPADESADVPLDGDLIVTFDEEISLGDNGVITVKNLTDTSETTINITDGSQVSISGTVLTINPNTNLMYSKDYAVQIADTAITDLIGNPFAGITDDTTWNFTTEDAPPPGQVFFDDFEVESGSPNVDAASSDGSTSGEADATRWVRATEGYGAGENGIVDESGGDFTDPVGEQAYAIRYTNSGVTTAEGVIGNLAAGTTYTVTFDIVIDGHNGGAAYNVSLVTFNGASRNDVRANTGATSSLVNESGTATASYQAVTLEYTADGSESSLGHDVAIRVFGSGSHGIMDNVEVVTSSIDSAAPTISLLSPADGATDVAVDSNLVVTYDRDIATGNGNIILKNLTDTTESTIDITDGSQATITGSALIINPAGDLLNGKDYAVRIDSGAVKDTAENLFAGISTDTTWNFSTIAASFADWISGYNVGGQTALDDDYDGDRVSNAAENYFGTNPESFSAGLTAKQVNTTGTTTFKFSHPISDTPAPDLTASYRWSKDLSTFYADGLPDPDATTVSFSVAPPANGEVEVTATVSGAEADRVFVDVEVTPNN